MPTRIELTLEQSQQGVSNDVLSRMSNTSDKGTTFGDGAARVGMQLRSSPKVSTSSPLVSPSTIINVPRELYSIDVCYHLFEVPLTMFDVRIADVIPCKVSYADDSINLNVDESTIPSDPIVQSVDINKSTSYAGVAGGSAKDQPNVNSNFRTLGLIRETWAEKDYDEFQRLLFYIIDSRAGLEANLRVSLDDSSSFARCLIKVNSEADLVDVVTIGIPSLFEDDFTKETIRVEYEWRPPRCDTCKRKKRKATTSAPKKGTTYVGYTSQSTPMLKTTGNSSKKDNLSMSNSFSALNEEEEEEDVENVYDESANLIQNTKAGGSSSFTAAAG
ncbi:hypothetical protein Tco_0307678 [Tanacetum coccineum]